MTHAMCVSACSLLVAVMVTVVVGGGTPSNMPEVRRDVRQATMHTATCSTDNGYTEHITNSKLISIDLGRHNKLGVYLARVSIKIPCALRNTSFNETLAARGCLKTSGTSNVKVGLLEASSPYLKMDGAKCKYMYSTDTGTKPFVEDAMVAVPTVKVITWNIDPAPEGDSVVIESPMGEDQEAILFDSAQSPLDSLEFLHPEQPNDPTMFIWQHNPHKGLMSLTVIALSDSPLVTNSDRFECRVKIGSTYRACVNLSSTEDSQEDGLQVWLIVLISCLACIAVISVVLVVLFVVLRRRRQRDRAAIATDTADNKTNEGKEEDEESTMAGHVQASDDVSIRHNANDIANESDLGLLQSNTEDLA